MIDKNRLRLLLFRFWWLILLAVIVTMLSTFAWMQRQVAVYSSRAVIEVAQQEDVILKVEGVKKDNPAGSDYLSTVAESLTGDGVLLAAAREIDLYDELRKSGQTDSAIVETLRSKVASRVRGRTRLIDVVASDVDPVRAQKLANAIVAAYLDRSTTDRSSRSGVATDYLKDQAKRLDAELTAARNAVSEFRLKHKDLPLENEGQPTGTRASELGDKLLGVQNQRAQIEADLARANGVAPGSEMELLQISTLAAIPKVAEANAELKEQQSAFEQIKKRYLEQHPRYIQATENVAAAEDTLKRLLGDAVPLLKERAGQAGLVEKQIQEAIAQMNEGSSELSKVLVPYRILMSEVDSVQKRYNEVTNRIAEIGMKEKAADRVPVTIAEAALLPSTPMSRTGSMLSKAALAGLAIGLALIFLIDRLDQTYQSVEHLESELGVSVLASVPDDKVEKRRGSHGITTVADRNSLQAEAYRTLRAALSLLGDESRRRVFLVTSALPGEGKSRTSANLAVAFAQRGLRTLLIDADLRRPSQQKVLEDTLKSSGDDSTGEKHPGLSEYLSGLCTFTEACSQTTVDNFTVILAGGRSPQPADLLAQTAFGEMLELAQQQFDRVVVDTPPVNSVSDAIIMLPHVHSVCLVVRAGHTTRRAVKRALENLTRAGARLAGVILNRQRSGVYSYYYNYRYDPYIKGDRTEKAQDPG
jgi:capsular exopolysaccharide synthesis family protein